MPVSDMNSDTVIVSRRQQKNFFKKWIDSSLNLPVKYRAKKKNNHPLKKLKKITILNMILLNTNVPSKMHGASSSDSFVSRNEF